jgi:hypothetical protein
MKTILVVGLLACLLLIVPASARVVTVRDVVDYTDNGPGIPYYFWDQNEILDHSPFHRHGWEDWGWTHDVAAKLPIDVNGIQSATLSIEAWDVDAAEGEVDEITINDTVVGSLTGQPENTDRQWTTTTFQLSPTLLQELYRDGKIDVFMNIDKYLVGDRVTINSSTLVARFTASGEFSEPNVAVYRFWSPVLSSHFYTTREAERDWLIAEYPGIWTYEGPVYSTFGDALDANLKPVYRFWGPSLGAHFYTLNEDEKMNLLVNWGHVWTYEGPVFYAYPEGLQPPNALPVYRFWSPVLSKHFYTISEIERQWLIDDYPDVWTLEGIAWYAYEWGQTANPQ